MKDVYTIVAMIFAEAAEFFNFSGVLANSPVRWKPV
jgi:hypothetical protein